MKETINNLKDYAELAWASYFNIEFIGNRNIFELDSNNEKIPDTSYPRKYKETKVNLLHSVSQKYQGQEVLVNLEKGDDIFTKMKNDASESFNFDTLNGEFGEIQAQNFAKRYEIRLHQPNTFSGFSATLFYDKEKDRFVVGFRGTEFTRINDIIQDIALSLGDNPQSFALLDFLKEVRKIVQVYNRPTIFVGHSLGGYLAQIALIYCDKTYKDELLFSPQEVYTFNSPSIYGWNVPNIVLNPNTIKLLLEVLGKSLIDTSEKLTHIYDSGGINIIASAQYGSRNRLPIYTGKDSHSIIPLTQTLYFYSYLLELESNDTTIQRAIANKQSNKATTNNTNTPNTHTDSTTSHKDTRHHNTDSTHTTDNTNVATQPHDTLADYLHELNIFMDNIKTYVITFVDTANKENTRNFNRKNGPLTLVRQKPESIGFFPYFLSKVAVIVGEAPSVLKDSQDNYYEKHKQPAISNKDIIDFIIKLHEKQLYVCICNGEYFNIMRKEVEKINNKENLGEKIALGTQRNFYVVDKNNACIETYESIVKAYGYNSEEYNITQQVWEQEYLGAVCKISQALYANGKAKIGVQYAE